jgi:hypothetical protein
VHIAREWRGPGIKLSFDNHRRFSRHWETGTELALGTAARPYQLTGTYVRA